jgi:serine/threonine-protein kinase RsbW
MASNSYFSPASADRPIHDEGKPERMKAALNLASDGAEIGRLLHFAEEFAHGQGLAVGDRAWLMIILEELFVNAIEHGYRGRTTGHIEIGLRVQAGRTTIHFSDDAPPFDPLGWTAPDLDLPIGERPIGGLGLHLLRAGVDRARYRRVAGRNHLVLIRRVHH